MAIAANKVPGVRAAVAWSEEIARLAREHNDANVYRWLRVSRLLTNLRRSCAPGFAAKFDGGRHERRVEKIREIELDELNHHTTAGH